LAKYFSLAIALLFVAVLVTPAMALDKQPDRLTEASYNMVGLRLGAWVADSKVINEADIHGEFPDASFFTEIYFDHRVFKTVFLELSLGVASRGDVVLESGNDRYIGTINLYPIMLQAKISPLSGKSRSILPFIIGGGGFVHGKQNTDIVRTADNSYVHPYFVEESETTLLYSYGGGIDFAISEQIGFSAAAKYHHINFGDPLAGVTDYSALAISVGVSYFIHKK